MLLNVLCYLFTYDLMIQIPRYLILNSILTIIIGFLVKEFIDIKGFR